ncbi:hypothetical protein [Actinomadura roseirufa]|uniref:hypothetical protein n=1 Tax=Actinomadura roseirufa TaxID=2094049 RepID=UPI001040EDBC|nr:hypothetical protein [Actinomadura roseirufa]
MNATHDIGHPHTTRTFRAVKLLLGAYTAVSVLMLGAVYLLRGHHGMVNDSVWSRCTIVAATSPVLLWLARRAADGSSRAYRRLRVVSGVLVLVITVIITLPAFPAWVRVEQAGCGLLLLGVVALVNGRRLRTLFDAR